MSFWYVYFQLWTDIVLVFPLLTMNKYKSTGYFISRQLQFNSTDSLLNFSVLTEGEIDEHLTSIAERDWARLGHIEEG